MILGFVNNSNVYLFSRGVPKNLIRRVSFTLFLGG